MSITTSTKERPILFSGEMVRAILAGQKTQTRRVAKARRKPGFGCVPVATIAEHFDEFGDLSPYAVGDLLWVRETWAEGGRSTQLPCGEFVWSSHLKARYKATDDAIKNGDQGCNWRVRPSIHMPRWASRLTLRVTAVRVERLQDITPHDALAEGVRYQHCDECPPDSRAIDGFHTLWDSLNAKRGHGWDTNPWVWVYAFERITA